jgi:hypothetical protein
MQVTDDVEDVEIDSCRDTMSQRLFIVTMTQRQEMMIYISTMQIKNKRRRRR